MIVLDTIPLMDVNANTHALYSKNAFDYFQPKDPKLDSLIEAWRSTVDPAAQLRISHQLQRYLQDMAYYPAVTGSPLFQATRDYVKGFKFLGRMANDYRTVWLDR
jgi:ABC-type transport system substrate-binding protein